MQVDWSKLFSYINKGADRDTIIEVENWRKKDVRNEDFYRRACLLSVLCPPGKWA